MKEKAPTEEDEQQLFDRENSDQVVNDEGEGQIRQ